jgi:hypothetical protein
MVPREDQPSSHSNFCYRDDRLMSPPVGERLVQVLVCCYFLLDIPGLSRGLSLCLDHDPCRAVYLGHYTDHRTLKSYSCYVLHLWGRLQQCDRCYNCLFVMAVVVIDLDMCLCYFVKKRSCRFELVGVS